MERYFLGVDGGGSKTTAVVADEKGHIVVRAVGASINYYSNPLEATRRNMADILHEITEKSGIDSFSGAFIGMSALNGKASEVELQNFTKDIINSDRICMDSDLFIALSAMLSDSECAVAISGTGSMVAARNDNGEISHTGGWGYLLGDEGSGYALSLSAVRAAVRGGEGSAPQTALTERTLEFFGCSDFNDLVEKFYNPPISRTAIAAFLPVLRECADMGDCVSREIIQQGAADFAATTLALLKKFKSDIPVGLWGGMFEHTPLFKDTFTGVLCSAGYINVSLLDYPPVIGAVFAAYGLCNVTITDEILRNIGTGAQK